MEADWDETKLILQEVEKLFETEDDIKDVKDVRKMLSEIGFILTTTRND